MKIIFEPKVYIQGRQTVDHENLDRFLRDHNVGAWTTDSLVGAEVLVEEAGRVCYMSFAKPRPGGNEAYIKHIKEVGHGSVLEHAVWNILITDVSRTLTHELVRHRAGFSYSQLSQRYVDESVCEVVCPHELRDEVRLAQIYLKDYSVSITQAMERNAKGLVYNEDVVIGLIWLSQMDLSNATYRRISEYLTKKIQTKQHDVYLAKTADVRDLKQWTYDEYVRSLDPEKRTGNRKTARQAARSVLPNATETKIFCTANGRSLRHFLEMRCSTFAEPEIRKLAHLMWKELNQESPHLFGDYREVLLDDGTVALETDYRKV